MRNTEQYSRKFEEIKNKIDRGEIDVDMRIDNDQNTLLHYYTSEDDIEAVKALLARGAHPNLTNMYGENGLMEAINVDNVELVTLLLKAGIHVDYLTLQLCESEPCLLALLDAPGNFDSTVTTESLYRLFFDNAHKSKALFDKFIERGSNYYGEIDYDGVSDTHEKVNVLNVAAASSDIKLLDYLIDGGADFNRKNSDGKDPLYYAAANGRTDSVLKITSVMDNKHQEYADGCSPLMIAVKKGQYHIAHHLLDQGFDPDCYDEKGNMMLYGLTKKYQDNDQKDNGCTSLMRKVLASGIAINREDIISPIVIAITHNNAAAFKCLMRHGCDLNQPITWTRPGGLHEKKSHYMGKTPAQVMLTKDKIDLDIFAYILAQYPEFIGLDKLIVKMIRPDPRLDDTKKQKHITNVQRLLSAKDVVNINNDERLALLFSTVLSGSYKKVGTNIYAAYAPLVHDFRHNDKTALEIAAQGGNHTMILACLALRENQAMGDEQNALGLFLQSLSRMDKPNYYADLNLVNIETMRLQDNMSLENKIESCCKIISTLVQSAINYEQDKKIEEEKTIALIEDNTVRTHKMRQLDDTSQSAMIALLAQIKNSMNDYHAILTQKREALHEKTHNPSQNGGNCTTDIVQPYHIMNILSDHIEQIIFDIGNFHDALTTQTNKTFICNSKPAPTFAMRHETQIGDDVKASKLAHSEISSLCSIS